MTSKTVLAFVLFLILAATGKGVLAASSAGFGSIAEKELLVSPPSQDRIIMGSSSVLVRDLGDDNSPRDLNWSVSINVRNFTPSGELKIVTGDRYDLAKVGSHPMIGAEICRHWGRFDAAISGAWNFANCLTASGSTTQLQLQTQSGYRLDHVRLTHLASNLNITIEKGFERFGLSALVDAGAGYLLVTQSGPNPTGTASRQSPFGTAGAAARWAPTAEFFAKVGYQYWVPMNSADAIPSGHWVLSGGFLF